QTKAGRRDPRRVSGFNGTRGDAAAAASSGDSAPAACQLRPARITPGVAAQGGPRAERAAAEDGAPLPARPTAAGGLRRFSDGALPDQWAAGAQRGGLWVDRFY